MDKRIEEYKKELMKYAKKNGFVYSINNDGFKEAEITDPDIQQPKTYDAKFVSNRPMPSEFLGDDESDIQKKSEKYKLTYNKFIDENSKHGKLRVQTYASLQVFPIQNAKVSVEKEFDDGTHIFAEEYTDIDGVAENITLPTKSKELSLTPDSPIPYATYTVKVSHPQFESITFSNVPIFEGIESLQPVAMLPLNSTNQSTQIFEENPDL